jgi:hypothetical protein
MRLLSAAFLPIVALEMLAAQGCTTILGDGSYRVEGQGDAGCDAGDGGVCGDAQASNHSREVPLRGTTACSQKLTPTASLWRYRY